jgi:subtilisin family serine protease
MFSPLPRPQLIEMTPASGSLVNKTDHPSCATGRRSVDTPVFRHSFVGEFMKRLVLAVAAIAFTACNDASGPGSELRPTTPATANASKGVPIPGAYIVTLRGDAGDVRTVARSMAGLHKGALKHFYKSALKGFSIQNISEAEAAAIASDPRVVRIEADQVMTAVATQTPATWGLDRVDQRSRPLNNSYTYDNDGSTVTVYIIDTGINFTHTDFGGRASTGFDVVTPDGSAADCNGHGTHVASTVGGTTYGIAKNVKLVAVRVLNCLGSGPMSGIIAGVDWITANRTLPAAANMSLIGGLSATLNQAVARSVAAGVTYAVAAGNNTADACTGSPASEPSAITVGATSNTDAFWSSSNFGSCVDINAPGVSITSAWYSSNTATNTMSGTSMAAPHVAGAAALYLSANLSATPAQVASALIGNATQGAITSLPAGTVNLLLYTAFIGGGAPPPPVLTASFTKSCSVWTCSFTNTSTNTSSATTYEWNFGDGSAIVTTTNATHTFAARRSYTVRLTAKDGSATSTTTKAVTCTKHNCS